MNTILSNTNESCSKNVVVSKTLIRQADDLANEHEQFNERYILGGRIALYELLGKMYSLYKALESADDKGELVIKMRDKLAKDFNIRTQENSSVATILVRYITRADRKTAHVYARAIEAACSNKISSEDFSDFIQDSGGVEQIRSIAVDPSIKVQQDDFEAKKMDLTKQFFLARTELPFATFTLKPDISVGGAVTEYEYFACVKRGGAYQVVSKIPADQSFEDRALRLFGNYLATDLETSSLRISELYEKAKKVNRERLEKETPIMAAAIKARDENTI